MSSYAMLLSMKISVRVKPGSKKEEVIRVDDTHFIVHVKALPVEGKANESLVRLLSNYFNVPKSHIQILKGTRGKDKLIEVTER
ncbi:MAG TPA: DUF167 domain-containing protein [Thermodesulfobacteriota bacterium]|nr:DUF167 domain-containing protein [Thermodesulfobacteriota bacterium]